MTDDKRFAGVVVSPYCSNRCLFCAYSGVKKTTDSEIQEQITAVNKNLVDFKKQGYENIEISGSDPLEYDRIADLITRIKKDFRWVKLSTNGVRLADESFLDGIINAGVDQLRIPVYGSKAGIHDSVTQARGSFGKTIKAPHIKLVLSSLILKQNRDDLKGIFDLAQGLKSDLFYFSIPCIAGNDEAYYIPYRGLEEYVRTVVIHGLENYYPLYFKDIPYCVFGFFNVWTNNRTYPPDLGRYNQPPDKFKTEIPNLPSYRLKTKISICSECLVNKLCDGFYVNDIQKYGSGDLKPIKKMLPFGV
jgi:MoaA/NifB/PqqE/SkfB family radical SAM enzyme